MERAADISNRTIAHAVRSIGAGPIRVRGLGQVRQIRPRRCRRQMTVILNARMRGRDASPPTCDASVPFCRPSTQPMPRQARKTRGRGDRDFAKAREAGQIGGRRQAGTGNPGTAPRQSRAFHALQSETIPAGRRHAARARDRSRIGACARRRPGPSGHDRLPAAGAGGFQLDRRIPDRLPGNIGGGELFKPAQGQPCSSGFGRWPASARKVPSSLPPVRLQARLLFEEGPPDCSGRRRPYSRR